MLTRYQNLEHAKTLLLRLEQETSQFTNPIKRQNLHNDISHKHSQIALLDSRLHELNATGQDYDDEPSSDSEDLLGANYTPSATESVDVSVHHASSGDVTDEEEDAQYKEILAERAAAAAASLAPPPPAQSSRDQLLGSASLRARNAGATSPSGQDTAQTTSSSTSKPMTEALLSHHSNEQEELTASLLAMAKALKESSQNFQLSLEEEKDIVERAGEGLDRNASGLEAASRRIGYLRQMSEGKGWWGRMMLYAWIFGLMMLAFFIVAFMPKLRF